ncbi:tetratricopeptide repeat protein [Rudanella lutea]|uniref:tetratricopeptide repeat protein n=1 Tax=Rudanella lutea TaxID=451374 RepID=UPI000365FAA8|nr:hypothetical protein [Rudanella lutea]
MEQLERIDRYLDRTLPVDEADKLEQMLQIDFELQSLLDRVTIVKDAVRSAGLRNQVRDLHFQFMHELDLDQPGDDVSDTAPEKVIVRPLWYQQPVRWTARIAASGLLLLLGYGTFQYATTNVGTLYSAKFIKYELPNTRGSEEAKTSLDVLYQAGNYDAVIEAFMTSPTQTQRDQFLTAMAYLQKEQYGQAIERFSTLRTLNEQNNRQLFEQESDYYLALAYLGNERIDEAYSLFKKIKNTPRHLYNQNVTEQDLWKLNLLRWKK